MIRFGDTSIGSSEIDAVRAVLDDGWLTHGPKCTQAESVLGGAVCSSGTAALHLALAAIGCGPGDEVILPATTFVATLNAVLYTGATPVVVDVRPDDWTIDERAVEAHITPRTKAVMPVWIYGVWPSISPVAMEEIRRRHYRRHGKVLWSIEDRSESCPRPGDGECWPNTIETFSFYGNKVITCGEGGLVRSADDLVMERVRHLRGHAQEGRYAHDALGFNYRMTEMQAAVLLCQYKRAEGFIEKRNALQDRYAKALKPHNRFFAQRGTFHVAWGMGVQILGGSSLAGVMAQMKAAGIETRPCFTPVNMTPQCPHRYSETKVASRLRDTVIVLPLHQNMTLDDVDFVCQTLLEATK